MSRIWVIATSTFREAVRDRILNSILFFAVLLLGVSLGLREVSIGDTDKIVRGVALGGVSLLASLIALFLGVSLVYKEIEKRTIYTLAAKPIARWQLLLGKYLGIWITLAAEVVLLGLLYVMIVSPQQGLPGLPVLVAWLLLMVELSLLSVWAMLFSTFASPVTATAYSLSLFVIGHFADDLHLFGERADPGAFRTLVMALYRVVPNLETFNVRAEAVHDVAVPWSEVAWSTAYGAGYTVAVLCVAMLVFTKRDFK
jgi:ABC-type transport system involved in multi-copper enzyme maturation permease subunit